MFIDLRYEDFMNVLKNLGKTVFVCEPEDGIGNSRCHTCFVTRILYN